MNYPNSPVVRKPTENSTEVQEFNNIHVSYVAGTPHFEGYECKIVNKYTPITLWMNTF